MGWCVMKNCTSNPKNGIRLFRLPSSLRNAQRRKIWEEFINRDKIPKQAQICEFHFSDEQFELNRQDNRKLLRWNAVPDIITWKQNLEVQLIEENMIKIEESIIEDDHHILNESIVKTEIKIENIEENQCSSNEDVVKVEVDNIEENKSSSNLTAINAEEYTNNISTDNLTIPVLKNRFILATNKIKRLEQQIEKLKAKYEEIFNVDQVNFLINGSGKGCTWSEETINKSLKLYMACGNKGYEEVRNQKLPYPSARTLQYRTQQMKYKLGNLEDFYNMLQKKINN